MECVTVLLATYNQEQYIYQAIDSILMQDYGNIQLIIADDCSNYFDVEVISRYVAQRKKENIIEVQVVKSKTNVGTVRNLNNARKYILGRYLVLLAGDDMFYNNKTLTNYVEAFAKQQEDVGILISQVFHYDSKMEKIMYPCVTEEQKSIINCGDNSKLYGYLCMDCFLPAIGSAYDMQIVGKYGDFDERYYLVEDWPYYLKLIRNGVGVRYEEFISAKHRDGGVSHNKKDRVSQRNDRYHRDLIAIMQNEILENYHFAPEKLRHKIYVNANDRVVISDFRKNFSNMGIKQKIKWILKHYYLPGIIVRGIGRRLSFVDKHNTI